MSRWLFILLAACGGAARPSPAPIGNVATPSPSERADTASPGGYSDGAGGFIADADGDGVADSVDECPDIAEDYDDFAESDGCPDLDNDADGIPDVDDECPYHAARPGVDQEADGCGG